MDYQSAAAILGLDLDLVTGANDASKDRSW